MVNPLEFSLWISIFFTPTNIHNSLANQSLAKKKNKTKTRMPKIKKNTVWNTDTDPIICQIIAKYFFFRSF